ncbi:hypothetical protein SLE2022_325130 [Rubroshorea leprosula]
MDTWGVILLKLAANALTVLSWPSFTLIYPLWASVWSIQSDSSSKNQQCLTYWVLFALFTMLELTFTKLLRWFPFWPYAKGIATLLLVTPHFIGASHVYNQFIQHFIENSLIQYILLPQTKKPFPLNSQNDVIAATAAADDDDNGDRNGPKKGPELGKPDFQSQGNLDPISENQEVDHTWKSSPKKVQKEWSCALCLISTTSEKCLKKHLRGKKHKAKEEEQRAVKTIDNRFLMPNRTDRMLFLKSLNQIARINLERWSGILGPVTRSIRRCKWKKPQIGWIKLNTDGSVDLENAGFGGLLRNHKGDPICAFVSKAPRDDVFLVELWAVWRGLVLALSLGVKLIWVESDSLPVVKTINREQHYGTKASQCLKHIWELLTKFENYKVTHSWRETNQAADHLSKMILSGSDVVLWPGDFPKSLRDIIQDDAQGRIYHRRGLPFCLPISH